VIIHKFSIISQVLTAVVEQVQNSRSPSILLSNLNQRSVAEFDCV